MKRLNLKLQIIECLVRSLKIIFVKIYENQISSTTLGYIEGELEANPFSYLKMWQVSFNKCNKQVNIEGNRKNKEIGTSTICELGLLHSPIVTYCIWRGPWPSAVRWQVDCGSLSSCCLQRMLLVIQEKWRLGQVQQNMYRQTEDSQKGGGILGGHLELFYCSP